MSSDERISLGELLLETADMVIGRMFVKIPGTVIAQDPATLRVTVQPACRAYERNPENDALVPFELPVIPNVPVQYPTGGGINITWPLLPGDSVWLEIVDHSLDEWHGGQPEPVFVADQRRFSLSDAIAVPGARKNANPVPATAVAPGALVVEAPDIRLGSSAAVQTVALSPLVDARLTAIETFLATHVHAGVTTGAGVSGVAAGAPSGSPTGAVKTKAE